jgi:hypothetical protein
MWSDGDRQTSALFDYAWSDGDRQTRIPPE